MPPRNSSSASSKFIGGSPLQEELQGVAAFVALAEIHRKGDSITQAMQHAMIGEKYFGDASDPDSIGLAEQLVNGNGVFRGLYTLLDDEDGIASLSSVITDKGYSERSNKHHDRQTDKIRLFKPELHCLGPSTRIIAGNRDGITLPLLLQKGLSGGDEKVAPRTLFNRAKESAKNCRKALSYVMAEESPYKDFLHSGNLPSGMRFEDYLLYVRQKMWEDGQNNPSTGGDESEERRVVADVNDNPDKNTRDDSQRMKIVLMMPSTWFFPGFIVFALMGPIVLASGSSGEDYRCELILTSIAAPKTKDDKLLQGRLYGSRTNRLPAKDDYGDDNISILSNVSKKRTTKNSKLTKQDTPRQHSGHEVSLSHRLQAAGLAQAELMAENRRKAKTNDLIIDMHTNKVMGKQALITETRELVHLMAPEDPMRPAQIQKLVQLNDELRQALNELEQAQQRAIHRELEDVDNRVDYSVENCDEDNYSTAGNMNKQQGTSSTKNAVPLVLPSSTPSILRSTIMDVLYADRRCHTPVSEGMSKQHQKTKKQKVVRTNSRSSPISGISDDGSSSPKSGVVPCVVLGGSASSAAVSFTMALSPSMTEGRSLTRILCVECRTNPSNHHCRKCDVIVCGVCCASKRGLEGTWWCGSCFNKRSTHIQKTIRDHEYISDDDDANQNCSTLV